MPLETESTTSRVLSDAHELVSFALWLTAPAASFAACLASFACNRLQPTVECVRLEPLSSNEQWPRRSAFVR